MHRAIKASKAGVAAATPISETDIFKRFTIDCHTNTSNLMVALMLMLRIISDELHFTLLADEVVWHTSIF